MDNRIIELAVEALEKRKAAVETEIAGLKSAMSKQQGHAAATAKAAPRRSQSERMKAYWARKRAAAKVSKPVEVRKPGSQSAASRKAISERMKAYWAKRKAAKVKGPKQAKA